MNCDWCYCICLLFMLCAIVAGTVASVFIYFLVATSVDWPTEKWEYKDLAIICDAKHCAEIAKNIFDKGGSMGDAAVAALLCMGVTAPHLSGIGGGLMAVFYNSSTNTLLALDALGHSPKATKPDMFSANPDLAKSGSQAPIVPGAVAGYKALHKKLGTLQWSMLFEDTIKLAENGFAIGPNLAEAILRNTDRLSKNPDAMYPFYNTETKQWLQKYDTLFQPELAATLRRIAASKGGDVFYSGDLAEEIATSFKDDDGIITPEDFHDYKPRWLPALAAEISSGKTVYSAPFPGSGAIVGALFDSTNLSYTVLQGTVNKPPAPSMEGKALNEFVEKLKFIFAGRGELGDTKTAIDNQDKLSPEILARFEQRPDTGTPLGTQQYGKGYDMGEDFGGAHLSIRDIHGNALSVTTGINSEFGAKYPVLGIFMNNYMDAFGKPGGTFGTTETPFNLLQPRKRPLTFMVPAIVTNSSRKAKLHAVLGASGGLAAISALGQLFACAAKYPLISCILHNVRVHPKFEDAGIMVQVSPGNQAFDPGKLLLKFQQPVENALFTSAATAIITTARDSWMAPADTKRTDGSSTGTHYEHPVFKNPRT